MGDKYFIFDYGTEKSLKLKTRHVAVMGQEFQFSDGARYVVSKILTKVSFEKQYNEYTFTETLYILTKL